jgi:hypothetical protein
VLPSGAVNDFLAWEFFRYLFIPDNLGARQGKGLASRGEITSWPWGAVSCAGKDLLARYNGFANEIVGKVVSGMNGNMAVATVLLVITALRLIAIAITPLGLDVEEAQYWLWSQTPDAGYFSKPPMIAWWIGLTTALAGNTEFGVRLAAPFLQLISALLIWRIAGEAYDRRAGTLAALIWISLPASAIGGIVMSTDSPMLLFLLAMILVLTPLAKGERVSAIEATVAGIFAGLAMMSKYAAIYLPLGLLIWWFWQGRMDRTVKPRLVFLFLTGMLISLSPNLIWNFNHGFVTVGHLSHNANLDESTYSILRALNFLLSQAGVIGPLVLACWIFSLIGSDGSRLSRFWISLSIPALATITVQAFMSDANANWALASWPSAIVLLSGWLSRNWRGWSRIFGQVSIGVNFILGFFLLASIMVGSLGPLTPASDPFRRLRGWDQHASDLAKVLEEWPAEVIVAERRGIAAKLFWALRDTDVAVELIDFNGIADNHYEHRHPWTPVEGRRVILVNETATIENNGLTPHHRPSLSKTTISHRRERALYIHPAIETGSR